MARDRQKAKQRQQQRREERLRARREAEAAGDGADGAPSAEPGAGKVDGDDPAAVGRAAGETGAPPENIGQTGVGGRGTGPDRAKDLTPEEEDELFLDDEDFEVDQDELAEAEKEAGYAPRGKRGGRETVAPGAPTQASGGARVIAFLRACWAELQRVQWPDRKQTTQLTAIVLVFIILMGGYLGLLDAIVSRVVQEII